MTQYSEKSYKMASDNTKYNAAGKAVILEKWWVAWWERMGWSIWADAEWTEKPLVVRSSLLLPILLLTGSNNLLILALICHNL